MMPNEETALVASSSCGSWGLEQNPVSEAEDKDDLILGQKETRAGQYVRNCYPPTQGANLDQCSLFRNAYIPSTKIEKHICPFVDGSYCDGDGHNAVKFTTKSVDAAYLGINTKKASSFDRTTICVPLNMRNKSEGGPGFVESTGPRGFWGYDLGWLDDDESDSKYTFEQEGDPLEYDVRSYTMSTYTRIYSDEPEDIFWHPVPGLKIRDELEYKSKAYSLTIMFINSCQIYYKEDSNDPIFPADALQPDGLYVNGDSRARPLACIDWIEACPEGGDTCLPPYESKADKDDKVHAFMRFALQKSTIYHAVEYRGANALDAQTKIEDYMSLPLSKKPAQWIVESYNLFQTSLARIQYDALDIATGAGSELPFYELKSTEFPGEDFCHMLMVQTPKGFNTIRVAPQVWVILTPVILPLLAIETNVPFPENWRQFRPFRNLNLILIELSLWCFWDAVVWLWRKVFKSSSAPKPGAPPPRASSTHSQDGAEGVAQRRQNDPEYNTFKTVQPSLQRGRSSSKASASASKPPERSNDSTPKVGAAEPASHGQGSASGQGSSSKLADPAQFELPNER